MNHNFCLFLCRFKKLSTKSGRWVSQKAPPGPRADSDSTIVDGYTLDVRIRLHIFIM